MYPLWVQPSQASNKRTFNLKFLFVFSFLFLFFFLILFFLSMFLCPAPSADWRYSLSLWLDRKQKKKNRNKNRRKFAICDVPFGWEGDQLPKLLDNLWCTNYSLLATRCFEIIPITMNKKKKRRRNLKNKISVNCY